MQRLVFEFQKTCDNNLSFDAFRHKIENQLRTNERQKIQLDSLLGLENTKRLQEKKKREEMKQKKEEMERKKKEDEERQKRKEEKAKKKKEEEQKKKEEENRAANPTAAGSTSSTLTSTNTNTNQQASASTNSAAAPVDTTSQNKTSSNIESSQPKTNENSKNHEEKASNENKDNLNKSNKDEKSINQSLTSNASNNQENKDKAEIENDEKLDFSQGDMSVLTALEEEEKKKKKEAEEKKKKAKEEEKKDEENKDGQEKDKEKDKKKDEVNIGEAIMKNEHYEVFKKFNKMIGDDRITVPDTFLPDIQMKMLRQKAMNEVIDLDPNDIQYLFNELQSVRQTFDLFKKLVATIKRLDEKVELMEKNEENCLIISEDDILLYIKDYLEANEVAGIFLKNDIVRQTPFFEDFFEKILKYLETLSKMLKKRFFAFAKIEHNSLTINYGYLKNTMKKFSTPTLNLTQILKEIYTDLNSQILKYMLDQTVFIFETSEEEGTIKKFNRLDDSEDSFKIAHDSTPEHIKDYMDVLQSNAEKYFQVLMQISKIITTTPVESKIEELQDYLENKMEALMKEAPDHFQKPEVLEILKKFDIQMNSLHESFVFDMKGMAENIETTKLEESLKKRLLSLKNQMYTQMKALKDCADKEDYNFFQEIVLDHFMNINKETQKVIEKKKGHQNKRNCLEVIVMNYQLLSSLIELFENDLDEKSKTQIHYNCLYQILKSVKEYFQSYIDLDAVQQDEIILQKALHTFTDIQFLECQIFDQLKS
ncbi:hypothetical protein ABPG72_019374 [Tetrahymena utriculariae]